MKAWLLKDFKGLDALHLAEIPDPVPAPGEVLLAVDFAALNPADRYLSEGKYPAHPPLPHILGRDGVGRIAAVAPDVSNYKVGDRVIVLRTDIGVSRPGTFAEKVAVPAGFLAPAPAGWSDQEAGSAALVYLTAYQALTQWGNLPPSMVLVSGASGGVGVASIQLGVAMGHTIIALSRGTAKHAKLKEIGASICLDPTDPDWPAKLKKINGDRKVDLAIDTIAGPLFTQLISTLGSNGKVGVIGALAGPVPQFNTATLFFRRIKVGGVAVGSYSLPECQAAWKQIAEILNRANAKPLIDSVFPFEKLRDAFERLAQGPMGKVLIFVRAG